MIILGIEKPFTLRNLIYLSSVLKRLTAFQVTWGQTIPVYCRLRFCVVNAVSFFQRFIDCLTEKYQLCGSYACLDN